ncbi:SUPPRESSOR OF GAMMA RESPONSE 1-like protein [Drosera capensis]
MARPSWLVDGNRIATKIKSAAGAVDPGQINWKSNPSRACPNCHYTIDNSDVVQEWPGLPRGVKFDPEIILHLQAKLGLGNLKIHPFIDEFIPTVDEDDGICYTHPRNLPGVKQDGSAAHFFHRSIKAYNTGTRKRRKIQGDDMVDVRWHKTGRTKPVFLDGVQKGCKKIMVLYMNKPGGGRPEKTNWVMHQYHLGTEEDEKDGEFVISKVFYQQQQGKQSERNLEDIPEFVDDVSIKVDPITPKSVTPDPPRNERRACHDLGKETIVPDMDFMAQDYEMGSPGFARQAEHKLPGDEVQEGADNRIDHIVTVDQIDEIGARIQIDHIGAVDQIDETGGENQMDETVAENQIDHVFDNNGDEGGGDPK